MLLLVDAGICQERQIENELLNGYLKNRDWAGEYACVVFAELTVDHPDPKIANFTEVWYSNCYSRENGAARLDSQTQSKAKLDGISNGGLLVSFFSRGKDYFVFVGNSSKKSDFFDAPDAKTRDAKPRKLVYINPLELLFIGWAGFEPKPIPTEQPDLIKKMFARYEVSASKQFENRTTVEIKVFPDDLIFDTLVFDSSFGNMPVSRVSVMRNGDKSNVIEEVKATWKSPDREHWFPHEMTIDSELGAGIRKSWKLKFYWVVSDVDQAIFDPTEGGALRFNEVIDLVTSSAFNHQ